jgi:hypothetical protein
VKTGERMMGGEGRDVVRWDILISTVERIVNVNEEEK